MGGAACGSVCRELPAEPPASSPAAAAARRRDGTLLRSGAAHRAGPGAAPERGSPARQPLQRRWRQWWRPRQAAAAVRQHEGGKAAGQRGGSLRAQGGPGEGPRGGTEAGQGKDRVEGPRRHRAASRGGGQGCDSGRRAVALWEALKGGVGRGSPAA